MLVDILIREKDGDRGFYVPILPDKIEHKTGGVTSAEYDILNRGKVTVPTGTGLREVSWESLFPGINRTAPGLIRGGTPKAPAWYQQTLDDWRRQGTTLLLMVYCYPINLHVYVKDFSTTPTGGFGDLEYSVTFEERRELTLWPVKPESGDQSEERTAAAAATTYTVKTGDCLWRIAKHTLGSGTRWQEIFYANQALLEATAKKYHSYCTLNHPIIYTGTVLTIPAA